MSTFTTAAGVFDTAVTTFITALGAFQAAATVVQAAKVSQTNPYGSPRLSNGTGSAILQKMVHYAAFQQLLLEAEQQDIIARYAQGGIPGTAGPLTVLATVYSAD